MKWVSIGDAQDDLPRLPRKRSFIEFGPTPKIRPHEIDTWKIFFGMGLAAGSLLFGARPLSKGGKGYL